MRANKGGNFNPVPLPSPETTVARCYSLIHIGTVPNVFNGKVDPQNPKTEKIYVTWELPKLKAVFNEDKGEEPFVTGVNLTLSTNENSNLSKLIAQWRNKPLTADEQESFDPTVMVGKTCIISFGHKRKSKFKHQDVSEVTNENSVISINAISPKPKEMECPANINPYYIWDWEAIESGKKEFDLEEFKKMPGWLQKMCMESDQFEKYGQSPEEENNQSDNTPSDTSPPAKDEPVSDDGW